MKVMVFAIALAALAAFSVSACAQESRGYVEDWSTHHSVFSNPGTERQALDNGTYDKWLKVTGNARFRMQEARRNYAMGRRPLSQKKFKRDWSMVTGTETASTLTLSVTGTPGSGTVSSSSTLTIGSQTFTGSAPTAGSQTGSFTGQPTNNQTFKIANTVTGNTLTLTASSVGTATITINTIPSGGDTVTIGGTAICFGNFFTGCGFNFNTVTIDSTTTLEASDLASAIPGYVTSVTATSSGNVVTLTNTGTSSVSLARSSSHITISGSSVPGNGHASGCTSSTTGYFLNVTTGTTDLATSLADVIASCDASFPTVGVTATSTGATVTVTDDKPGSQATGVTLTETLSNFSLAGSTIPAGTDGANSATTFKYTTSGAYDTQAQLAADLHAAIAQNATITGELTVSYTAGATSLTLSNSSNSAYTVSDASFTALGGTGTLAAGNNSTVQPNAYPAKYNFDDTSTPTCFTSSTDVGDFVVYPTGYAGADGPAGTATLVGYDNLYKTTCGSTTPGILFAYNTGTGSTAGLSPVLSEDGTQVAFVQVNSSNAASLVLLKWAAGLSADKSVTCTATYNSANLTSCTGITPSAAIVDAPITQTSSGTTYIPSGSTVTGYSGSTITMSATDTVPNTQTVTFNGEPANNSTVTVGSKVFCFHSGSGGCRW